MINHHGPGLPAWRWGGAGHRSADGQEPRFTGSQNPVCGPYLFHFYKGGTRTSCFYPVLTSILSIFSDLFGGGGT